MTWAPRLSLVTGGSGFIGGHLVRMLAARGERVRILDIHPPAQKLDGVSWIEGSICDAKSVREALEGAERLFHLAANPNLWARDKSTFRQVNLEGTRIVLDEAGRAGTPRIIYCSTESILKSWRRNSATPIANGDFDLGPDDMPGPYTISKLLAEREAIAAAARGLPVIIVNPTVPMGPGDRLLSPPTRMLLNFLNGETPAYLDCAFNVVDVRHAAFAHILAAERGRIGERYILGGVNVRLGDLLVTLGEVTGLRMPRYKVPYGIALAVATVSEFIADRVTHRPPVAPLAGVRLARTPMLFDSSKAQLKLGMPETNLRRTLAEAVAWLVERGLVRRSVPNLAAMQLESAP